MKDLLGREIQTGQFICYGLVVGRSANLAVYMVKEVFPDKIRAIKLTESYGPDIKVTCTNGNIVPDRHAKFFYDSDLQYGYEEMTQEQKDKIDNKTSILKMAERVFILDGFTPELFEL